MGKPFNYRGYIRSYLRRIWLWHPVRREVLLRAEVSRGVIKCESCGLRMQKNPPAGTKKQYEVDHVIPASEPAAEIVSWDDFIRRLLEVTKKDLRVLCKECHGKKTSEENKIRRAKSSTKVSKTKSTP